MFPVTAVDIARKRRPAPPKALAGVVVLAAALTVALACAAPPAALADGAAAKSPSPAPSVQAAGASSAPGKAEEKAVWKAEGQRVYCYVGGKKQKGLVEIGGRRYYFDKKGVQRTGWRKIGGAYYYFRPGQKAAGCMATSCVVNGVRLKASGRAALNSQARAELAIHVKASAFVDKYTKPAQTKREKLKACFLVLKNKYSIHAYRGFSTKPGWYRAFALDIFNKKAGTCHSYACAFAYIANAVGYKNCKIVSSGGHSWAEINGKVYDPDWTKVTRRLLFAVPYSDSGKGGLPRYKSSRAYMVTIAPNTKQLKSSPLKTVRP